MIARLTAFLAIGCLCLVSSLAQSPSTNAPAATSRKGLIELKVKDYIPDWVDNPMTVLVNEYVSRHPDVLVKPFTQLRLPGEGMADGPLFLAFAGGIGPDVYRCWFHQLQSWVDQGFVADLSEFVGKDENGDGYIDDKEAKIEEWRRLSPVLRRAATVNGKPYGLPAGNPVTCIIYRRDLVREVTGSDEAPRTWDEFFRICQKLTREGRTLPDGTKESARRGFFADPNTFRWLPWLWSAGGREIVQVRTSPTTGKTYEFPKETPNFLTPESEDLGLQPSEWRATFASEEGKKAMEFYWKLFHQKWIKDPGNRNEPVNLTEEDFKAGQVQVGNRVVKFDREKDVFEGVSFGVLNDGKSQVGEMFRKGEVAFYIGFASEVAEHSRFMPASQIGLMAVPSPDGSRVTANIQPNFFFCLNSALANAPEPKRRAAFELVRHISGDNFMRAQLEDYRQKGMLNFADPEDLARFGMEEHIPDVLPHWVESLKEIKQNAQTEPYIGKWQPISVQLLGQEIISRIIVDGNYDYRKALDVAQQNANTKVLPEDNQEVLRELRPKAYVIFAVFLVVFIFLCKKMWDGMKQAYLKKPAGGFDTRVQEVTVITRVLPWVFVLPSLALVLMWTYYPLGQGAVIAFQDYKILADKTFVGLDNFILVVTDPKFAKYMWITFKFVVINIALGFVLPIVLAVMLNEIPRGKVFFRMVYLLPQVSSGIVIAFIWMMMYKPTPDGYFNMILMNLGLIEKPLQFLSSPNMALIWVTIPSVWAGIGGGSLIYLAALKSIPEDLYEAADIDGAGFWQKIFRIMLPTLTPLIIINFIGTFIGLFKSMGNIFLMTGGGPGDETTVISFAIWRDSFMFLKFGTATATAWVLAALLISFTVLQMRILSKVEFRKAEE